MPVIDTRRLPVRSVLEEDSESCYNGSMKTTIDIPDTMLAEAMRNTRATTKREAVLSALEMLNRRHRVGKLLKRLGTSETFITVEELMVERERDLPPESRLYDSSGHLVVDRAAPKRGKRRRKATNRRPAGR